LRKSLPLKLLVSKQAYRFLDKLPPKQFRQVLRKILVLLEEPRPHDTQQLKGYPFLRNDVGEYRIVYDLQGDTLRLLLVGKRNDDEIYKQL
jgi:mRNA interferase RelE/StbE